MLKTQPRLQRLASSGQMVLEDRQCGEIRIHLTQKKNQFEKEHKYFETTTIITKSLKEKTAITATCSLSGNLCQNTTNAVMVSNYCHVNAEAASSNITLK